MLGPTTDLKVLDVGCGWKKTPGAIGMDSLAASAADVVADLNDRWPFPDSSFDRVVANHVLEHVPDLVHVMDEAWRVLKPGGTFVLRGPHFSSPELVWSDPTHRRGLSVSMFRHFTPGTAHPYSKAQFRITRAELRLGGVSNVGQQRLWRRWVAPGLRLVQSWMNQSEAQQNRAERIYSRFLPFEELEMELESAGK
jgi:SAM-dependent methyltransferase